MGLSLSRKKGAARTPYDAYLRSPGWFRRRDEWIKRQRARGVEPACQGCGVRLADAGSLDLHHVDYSNLGEERDEDLWPFCRSCHEWIHGCFERRWKDFRGWNRRRATAYATTLLRRSLRKK